MKTGYVRNIEHDPHLRLKLREGLRYHWHPGTAQLLSDDDPRERQLWLSIIISCQAVQATHGRFASSGRNSSVFELNWMTKCERNSKRN